MTDGVRCVWCGKRDHVPDACPNRTTCKHGVYTDLPETGNPPCWQCEVEPYPKEASRESPSGHTLHTCKDEDCSVCRGELAYCEVCGGAEGSMPTDCPGVRMTAEQSDNVYARKQDFLKGEWVTR